LILGKWSLISWLRCLELSFLKTQVDFQDSELSLDSDLVKAFFLWFIFINNGDGLEDV